MTAGFGEVGSDLAVVAGNGGVGAVVEEGL
jgi:hypothetical protein